MPERPKHEVVSIDMETHSQAYRDGWRDAIDRVLQEMNALPPSKVGEAAFQRRLYRIKDEEK